MYIGRRLVLLVPQMLLISVVTFILARLLPGDPARLGQEAELPGHLLRTGQPILGKVEVEGAHSHSVSIAD
jgi:peptide/nickel transport system permease protein